LHHTATLCNTLQHTLQRTRMWAKGGGGGNACLVSDVLQTRAHTRARAGEREKEKREGESERKRESHTHMICMKMRAKGDGGGDIGWLRSGGSIKL